MRFMVCASARMVRCVITDALMLFSECCFQFYLIRLSVVELVMRLLRVGFAGVVLYLSSPPASQRGDSAARSLEISLPLHCVCVFHCTPHRRVAQPGCAQASRILSLSDWSRCGLGSAGFTVLRGCATAGLMCCSQCLLFPDSVRGGVASANSNWRGSPLRWWEGHRLRPGSVVLSLTSSITLRQIRFN